MVLKKGGRDKRLPIHFALEYDAPLKVVEYLLQHDNVNQSMLLELDGTKLGSSPLHLACATQVLNWKSPNWEVLEALLKQYSQMLFVKNNSGEVPLHSVCGDYDTWLLMPKLFSKLVMLLLKYDPEKKSLYERDKMVICPFIVLPGQSLI